MTDRREADVTLVLNGDEALVLFEWLARFNNGSSDFEDQAEQRVLWDLEAMLEKALVAPLRADYADLLATARERVRDNDIQ
ncbi:MAG: hypothetical protein KJ938_07500 [Actinobacteria bacterium]|jgi:hypothetical protein|nr:hypothetical protein [Gammaproteobacteria bacterium]MBU2074264.1 hypothetical protein [Actinomycetota bacterium]